MSLFSFAVTFHWKIISAHVKYKQIAVKYIQKLARKQSSSTKNPQKLPGSPGFHQKKSKSPGFPKEKNINFIQFPSFPQTFAHFHPFPCHRAPRFQAKLSPSNAPSSACWTRSWKSSSRQMSPGGHYWSREYMAIERTNSSPIPGLVNVNSLRTGKWWCIVDFVTFTTG